MPFNDLLSDGLIRHDIDLLRFDAKLRRQVLGQLRVMQDDILAQLANVDFSNVAKRQRLNTMLQQVGDIVRRGYGSINKHMLREINELAALEQSFQVSKMNELFTVDIVSAGLTPSALSAMSKATPVLGAPATEWWGRQSAGLRKRFSDQMRQGFLLGESTQDLVRRVRGSATGARRIVEIGGKTRSVAAFSGGIMDVTTREAEALVRTSVNSIANSVRLETYMKNTDVVGSVVAQVTLDSRTSDICQSHGAGPDEWSLPDFEPIGGSNNFTGPPPWHFNCRSSLVGVTKSWEALQKQGNARGATRNQRSIARKLDNNAPKRLRSSMDGQVPRGTSYDKWLKSQPKSVQVEALGAGRRKLWQQGKLNLTQTLDQTGRPLTLHQIGQLPANKPLPLKLPPRIPDPVPLRPPPTPQRTFTMPKAPTVTMSGLMKLGTNKMYVWNRELFKTIKSTPDEIRSVKWNPATGKFAPPSQATTVRIGSDLELPPGSAGFIAPPRGISVVTSGDLRTLTVGAEYRFQGEVYKVIKKTSNGLESVKWSTRTGKYVTPRNRTKITFGPKPPPVPPPPPPPTPPVAVGPKPPNATFVSPANYRTLKVADVFLDPEGLTWKVVSLSNRGAKAVPWSVKSGRFLAPRNGKVFGYSSTPAATFTAAAKNAAEQLKKVFTFEHTFSGYTVPKLSARLDIALDSARSVMGKNGFSQALAKYMSHPNTNVRAFDMGAYGKHKNYLGIRDRGRFNGVYYSGFGRRAMGMSGSGSNPLATWIHEFGHHIDFSILRNTLIRTSDLSIANARLLSGLRTLHSEMMSEYRAASRTVGRASKLRMSKGVISPSQQRNNWGKIESNLGRHAQSSYSLHDQWEWFAEAHAHYFNQRGTRTFMMRNQPKTFAFFEVLNSRALDDLWEALEKLATGSNPII